MPANKFKLTPDLKTLIKDELQRYRDNHNRANDKSEIKKATEKIFEKENITEKDEQAKVSGVSCHLGCIQEVVL